ncbi:MAG: HupE/UreJ family protein [Rhodobiaceae bacterium]|nr:HupE/UreJ family protein [Rhodobiaceae bacterium]
MKRLIVTGLILAASTAPAFAHYGHAGHGSLVSGFLHPLTGADHVLAMVAVGLWAALLGGRAVWAVPAAFVAMMGAGFMTALWGGMLPLVEPTILASVVTLGILVALAVRVPASVGMAVAGFFALFHGYAHGTEMAGGNGLSYMAGFAVATALLHGAGLAAGIGLSRLFAGLAGRTASRVAGLATMAGGVYLAIAG